MYVGIFKICLSKHCNYFRNKEKNKQTQKKLTEKFVYSDVVVQIVDARNPLLFRCEDLEQYVREVNQSKVNMVLINKADYLTYTQR